MSDLDSALADVWARLAAGTTDRRSAFRTPLVATVRDGLAPGARTVILRAVDTDAGTLRFHTDRRSGKVGELARQPTCVVHVYDGAAGLQVRMDGRACLHLDDALANAAWADAHPRSRAVYAQAVAPGVPVDAPQGAAGTAWDGAAMAAAVAEEPDAGRENFCAVVVTIGRVDRLDLDIAGNRRAAWTRDDAGGWHGTWLAP